MSFCRPQCEQSFKMRIFCGETQRHINQSNNNNNNNNTINTNSSSSGSGSGNGNHNNNLVNNNIVGVGKNAKDLGLSIKSEKGAGSADKLHPFPIATGGRGGGVDPSLIIITPELWSRGTTEDASPGGRRLTTQTLPSNQQRYDARKSSRHPSSRRHLERRQRTAHRMSSAASTTISPAQRRFNTVPRPPAPPPAAAQRTPHHPPPPPQQPQQPPLHQLPHMFHPLMAGRFGLPSATVLVPYPIAVPVPLPVPIPIPVPKSWIYDFPGRGGRRDTPSTTPTTHATAADSSPEPETLPIDLSMAAQRRCGACSPYADTPTSGGVSCDDSDCDVDDFDTPPAPLAPPPPLASTGSTLISTYSARRSRILDAAPPLDRHAASATAAVASSSSSSTTPAAATSATPGHAHHSRAHAPFPRNRKFAASATNVGGDEKRRCLQRSHHVKTK